MKRDEIRQEDDAEYCCNHEIFWGSSQSTFLAFFDLYLVRILDNPSPSACQTVNGRKGSVAEIITRNTWPAASGRIPAPCCSVWLISPIGQERSLAIVMRIIIWIQPMLARKTEGTVCRPSIDGILLFARRAEALTAAYHFGAREHVLHSNPCDYKRDRIGD